MKKLFAFISVLAACTAFMFADVSAQKNADGSVAVTFFYGNPRATEVLLAGDFTNWQNGALPMEKGEKGFSLTVNFKAGDEARYKFISDGNWTTDLRAPDFVDDGFGGKNSHIVVADLLGGDEDAQAARAKINFVSWSMIGVQSKFKTQAVEDKTNKGFDFDEATIGFKSYDKFVGNFLPNSPVYVEIALAETDLEDYAGNFKPLYLAKKGSDGEDVVALEDGLKNLASNIFTNPVAYFARTDNNSDGSSSSGSRPGPGSNPFLGHLKFGWNTPYLNFLTGFNYAKPDVRAAVTWTTVGGSSWDAGYQHAGGFTQFTLGDKLANAIDGVTLDIGFAPNKTADRKGTKYGYWGWAGAKIGELVVDFQSNGAYDSEYAFYDPVEHDFILGVKDELEVGDGKLSFAAQGLVATHQKSSDDLKADGASNVTDYFGYSTDVFYRSGDFDGIKNIAANAKVGYKAESFGANLEYRLRGMQASMLYVRQNHDDGTFDLSDQLGVLNSQRIAFDGFVNLLDDALALNLGVTAEMPLENIEKTDDYFTGYGKNLEGWYASRCAGEFEPLIGIDGGAKLTFKPAVTYTLEDMGMTFGVYADMNFNALGYDEDVYGADPCNYSASDSPFRFKVAGLTFNMKPEDNDVIKGVNVYYGFDNQNGARLFNTLIGAVELPMDITATAAIGIKTLKDTDAKKASIYEADEANNNPFAFALGVSKKFTALKKPTAYLQFVYNMDPFKHFGDGQDALNIDRANMKGSWQKEGVGSIDPVDWYDGEAAVRVGIRWDI